MFRTREWYLNYGPKAEEYKKAAKGFYPAEFNAAEWVSSIKDAGARYICITSRHHDGFSMWDTAEGEYDIVDGTPFGRDILKRTLRGMCPSGNSPFICIIPHPTGYATIIRKAVPARQQAATLGKPTGIHTTGS